MITVKFWATPTEKPVHCVCSPFDCQNGSTLKMVLQMFTDVLFLLLWCGKQQPRAEAYTLKTVFFLVSQHTHVVQLDSKGTFTKTNGNNFQSVATLRSCPTGYRASAAATTCQADGTWSTPIPMCEGKWTLNGNDFWRAWMYSNSVVGVCEIVLCPVCSINVFLVVKTVSFFSSNVWCTWKPTDIRHRWIVQYLTFNRRCHIRSAPPTACAKLSSPSHCHATRGNAHSYRPFRASRQAGSVSFLNRAPLLWNALTPEIRETSSQAAFKRRCLAMLQQNSEHEQFMTLCLNIPEFG